MDPATAETIQTCAGFAFLAFGVWCLFKYA